MTSKEYWDLVQYIRDDIFSRMVAAEIDVERDTSDVNPRFRQIANNGAIGLALHYGVPENLCTPLGALDIRTAGYSGMSTDIKKLMSELEDLYGLIESYPKTINYIGEIGPIFSITKVPGLDITLPLMQGLEREDFINEDAALFEYRSMNGTQDTTANVR